MSARQPVAWVIYKDRGKWWLALDGTRPGYTHVAGGSKKYCERFLKKLRVLPLEVIE